MNSIPATGLDPKADLLDQQGIPLHPLDQDLDGKPLQTPIQYSITINPRTILFAVQWPRQCSAHQAEKGAFAEGLWNYDCAELFLSNSATEHYLEFNLSPQAAWWNCLFHAPRERAPDGDKPIPGVRASHYPPKQLTVLSLPTPRVRNLLELGQNPQHKLLANVSLCSGSPQQFASVAPLSPPQPDFHRPDNFLPLHIS